MKFTKLLMTAAVAVVIAAPAMAQDATTGTMATTTTPVASTTTTTTTTAKTMTHTMPMHHHHHMMAGSQPMPFFDKLDTNHDGVITKDEWDADADKKFEEIDANHDGKITKGEMMKFHRSMMENHPEWDHHHMPPPPPGDQSWNHHTHWMHHSEYYSGNRPNIGAPMSSSVPPANNEIDPNDSRPAGADGAGGWTAQ